MASLPPFTLTTYSYLRSVLWILFVLLFFAKKSPLLLLPLLHFPRFLNKRFLSNNSKVLCTISVVKTSLYLSHCSLVGYNREREPPFRCVVLFSEIGQTTLSATCQYSLPEYHYGGVFFSQRSVFSISRGARTMMVGGGDNRSSSIRQFVGLTSTSTMYSVVAFFLLTQVAHPPGPENCVPGTSVMSFIPQLNKVYEGFGTFSVILFNDNFTPCFFRK